MGGKTEDDTSRAAVPAHDGVCGYAYFPAEHRDNEAISRKGKCDKVKWPLRMER